MKYLLILFLLIPFLGTSQNTGSLSENELRHIYRGLKQGELEHKILKAYIKKDKINDSIISSKDREIRYLREQINVKDDKIRLYKKQLNSSEFRLSLEKKKRFGVGPFFGVGYGTGSHSAQLIIGIGINYNIFKF